MATAIEWCDETWNPVVGCSRVSAGCDHCYAMGVAHRGLRPEHGGLTKMRPKDAKRPGVDWTGKVLAVPERLGTPLRWRKPRRVFVNSMSDLFHEALPFEFVAAVFGVMAACPQHTFLVLTKRPARALEFFAWLHRETRDPDGEWWGVGGVLQVMAGAHWPDLPEDEGDGIETGRFAQLVEVGEEWRPWPLANVHFGVSAEDQATWDERVPLLLQCPAAVRWVSVEPMLGPIDMHTRVIGGTALGFLNWIVVGGESGPGARMFDVAWARSLVQHCRDVRTPVFVKQLGAQPIDALDRDRWPTGTAFGEPVLHGSQWRARVKLRDRKGGDMAEWPADLRVRELPEVPRG
jgi:protein gp37